MASITKLEDRKKNPYRAQVRNKKFGTKVGYFPDLETAKEWTLDIEKAWLHLDKGMEPPKENLKRRTVETLVREYLKRRTPKKKTALGETKNLENFLAFKDFKNRPLHCFTRHDAYEYRDYLENEYQWAGKPYTDPRNGKVIVPTRQAKNIKPATVNRTIMILKNAWDVAAEEWRGYEDLPNPWLKVRQTEVMKKRTRRLKNGELSRLIYACQGCKGDYRLYAPLAIILAIETGMRLQEIFNLEWTDVHLQRRRIHIRKSKTDYKRSVNGRWIVLTVMGMFHLQELAEHTRHPKQGRLFPMGKEQFKQVWKDIVMRAGIPFQYRDYRMPGTDRTIIRDGEGLTFHDLRRDAGSRFKRCLFVDEIGAMLGHGDKTVTEVYLEYDEDDLSVIQDKLDRYVLGGLTFAEAQAKGLVVQIDEEEHTLQVFSLESIRQIGSESPVNTGNVVALNTGKARKCGVMTRS